MPLDNTNTPASNAEQYANFMPQAVRRAAERANELVQSLVADPAQGNLPLEQTGTVVETPPAATVVETPPATPPVQPAPTVDWEQRYRTLQGKYDHEVPTLRGDVIRLTSQLDALQSTLNTLQTPREVTPPPAAPAAPTVPHEDVETYGEDLVTAARRWARAEVAGELDELKRQFGELKQTTTTVQQETAQTRAQTQMQTMLAGLDGDPVIGGQWRAINVAPEFMTWLDQVDPFTGQQRMALLRDAFGRGDVVRTAAFFKAYLNEHTAPRTSEGGQPIPQPGAGQQPTLETFATPGRGSGPAPGGAPADKRIWTQRDITAFYRDRTRGAYRDREAEAARLEQDIIDAAAEGRIR